MCPRSVPAVFRKRWRTGVLKNRLRISITVPVGQPQGATGSMTPPRTTNSAPTDSPSARLRIVIWDTLPIDAIASPRNPSVLTLKSESSSGNLLVA